MFGNDEERDRVNADKKEDMTQGLAGNADPRDPNAETRPPRVQLSSGTNLSFDDVEMDKENFHYYAFLDDPDKPGRIERAKAAYWEHVTNKAGEPITRPAGGGLHYLMRLPLKYWREDLSLKKEKVARTMAEQTKLGPGEYAPDPETGAAEGGTSIYQERHSSDNPYS